MKSKKLKPIYTEEVKIGMDLKRFYFEYNAFLFHKSNHEESLVITISASHGYFPKQALNKSASLNDIAALNLVVDVSDMEDFEITRLIVDYIDSNSEKLEEIAKAIREEHGETVKREGVKV